MPMNTAVPFGTGMEVTVEPSTVEMGCENGSTASLIALEINKVMSIIFIRACRGMCILATHKWYRCISSSIKLADALAEKMNARTHRRRVSLQIASRYGSSTNSS